MLIPMSNLYWDIANKMRISNVNLPADESSLDMNQALNLTEVMLK